MRDRSATVHCDSDTKEHTKRFIAGSIFGCGDWLKCLMFECEKTSLACDSASKCGLDELRLMPSAPFTSSRQRERQSIVRK